MFPETNFRIFFFHFFVFFLGKYLKNSFRNANRDFFFCGISLYDPFQNVIALEVSPGAPSKIGSEMHP